MRISRLSHQFALNLYFLDDSWKDEFRKSTRDIKKHKPFTRVICKGPKLFKIDGLYISNISLKQKTFSALLKGFRLLIKPLHGLHHRQYENGNQSIHRCVSITNASLANKAHLYLLLLCNSRQWNVFNENVASIACLYFGTHQVYIGPKRMSVKSTHRFCCYLFRERLSKRWIERCKLLLPEENRSLVHAA